MAFRKVAEFKEVSYDFSSTGGTADVQLQTDLPGGAMADRLAGKTLPNTLGVRTTRTVPLDGIEGTLYKPSVTPAAGTVLRLYGGVIWLRPIGVHLDGSLGEKWESDELSIGV